MDMRSEIRKLARTEESPYPFLSLYIDTKWDDEQQRERIRLFTKNQLKRGYDQIKEREGWEGSAADATPWCSPLPQEIGHSPALSAKE